MKTSEEKLKEMHKQFHEIQVEVLEGGKLPSKAHKEDAGFDVFSVEDVIIYPGQIVKTPLNIRLKLPSGSWARVETKSGLGSKGMLVYAGVIDEGYRGIPHVIATNMKHKIMVDGILVDNLTPIIVKKGEKLAQITMNNHSTSFYIHQVERVDVDTDRGDGGFGSSGT